MESATEEQLLKLIVSDAADAKDREDWRQKLREGLLDAQIVELDVPAKGFNDKSGGMVGSVVDLGMLAQGVGDLLKTFKTGNKRVERKNFTVAQARPIIESMQSDALLETYDVTKEAIAAVEESGIVFIDEIDKLVSSSDYRSADASSEGVQRDLLPIIEGSAVNTKYGNVNTDYILFIASGAFNVSKPSDLLAELQGRLPIRVNLKALSQDDLYRILTEPVSNLIR